jgi:hypothetical protein
LVSEAGPTNTEKPPTFLTHKLKQNQRNARKLDKSPGLLQARTQAAGKPVCGAGTRFCSSKKKMTSSRICFLPKTPTPQIID